jgi:hypothetical protein
MRWTISRRVAFSALFCIGLIRYAEAEPVLLARGDDSFGQGWLFLDGMGQCRVATPRHVVEGANGKLVPPDLVDRFGQSHPTHTPVAATNADLDLSFLTVGGSLAQTPCTTDRLRVTPLQTILDSLKQAKLDVSTQGERQSIDVAIRAVSRDDSGGGIIAVSSIDPKIQFQKGMSGGTIIHNGRPLAMLFEVDSEAGVGIALRFDLIATEFQKLTALPSGPTAQNLHSVKELTLLKGRVAEQDSGLSSFLSGGSSLKLAPTDRRVILTVGTRSRPVVKGLKLRAVGATGNSYLIIETEKDHAGFLPGVRCPLSEVVSCTMAPRRADRLRITLTGTEGDIIEIKDLELISGDS